MTKKRFILKKKIALLLHCTNYGRMKRKTGTEREENFMYEITNSGIVSVKILTLTYFNTLNKLRINA